MSAERASTEDAFEREGLLDGLEPAERAARLSLLEQLADAGITMEELRAAVAEDRLALLPIQRLLDRNARYTLREYTELTGLSEEFLLRDYPALGLPAPAPDQVFFSDEQVQAGRMLKQVLDAGIPEERFMEMAYTVGRASAITAEAVLQMFADTFLQAGDTELDLGLRLAGLAEALMPTLRPLIGNAVELHMRHLVNSEVIDRTTRLTGELPGSTTVSVGFADLVGYTRLGETLGTKRAGEIASRFASMAADVAEPPVRLIKLIGDAAMFVCRETDPLLEALCKLVEAVEHDADLPTLRAGVARGGAFRYAGDWYGRPVNLASRITGVARTGTVLGTGDVIDSAKGRLDVSAFGEVTLKGIDQPVALYEVRARVK